MSPLRPSRLDLHRFSKSVPREGFEQGSLTTELAYDFGGLGLLTSSRRDSYRLVLVLGTSDIPLAK